MDTSRVAILKNHWIFLGFVPAVDQGDKNCCSGIKFATILNRGFSMNIYTLKLNIARKFLKRRKLIMIRETVIINRRLQLFVKVVDPEPFWRSFH